jgi:hypothetical protein
MRIREHQLDELARARALQDEAAKLHIPVPVLSYRYEITDTDGIIEEKGIGKSNSYTRNALNMLAWNVGFCDSSLKASAFTDGYISIKRSDGEISAQDPERYGTYAPTLVLGTSAAAESLDSYALPSSALTGMASQISSVFNSTTRKLITTISRTFKNNTESTINIVESGMFTEFDYSNKYALFIRDVFAPIPVEPGKSITWTYVTEVAYPEP